MSTTNTMIKNMKTKGLRALILLTIALVLLSLSVNAIGCESNSQCDDFNVCTDNICSDGTCLNPAIQGPCDDLDECTFEDACSEGTCAGTPIESFSCSVNEDCPNNICDESQGMCVCSEPTGCCYNNLLCNDDVNVCNDNFIPNGICGEECPFPEPPEELTFEQAKFDLEIVHNLLFDKVIQLIHIVKDQMFQIEFKIIEIQLVNNEYSSMPVSFWMPEEIYVYGKLGEINELLAMLFSSWDNVIDSGATEAFGDDTSQRLSDARELVVLAKEFENAGLWRQAFFCKYDAYRLLADSSNTPAECSDCADLADGDQCPAGCAACLCADNNNKVVGGETCPGP